MADGPPESAVAQAVLAAPTGVTATATAPNRIVVSWTGVAGASLYYIYRSDDGGATYTGIAAVHDPETTFDSAGLTSATRYGYKVTAFDPTDGQESPLSDPAFATTLPGPPDTVTATATSTSRITVSWTPVPTATLYYIYRSSGISPFEALAAVHAPETTFDDANLGPSPNCYSVQAFRPDGASELSGGVCADPYSPDVPIAPPNLKATVLSSSRVKLTWDPSPGADVYYIRSEGKDIGATLSTSFEVAGLKPATGYCFGVAAMRSSVRSIDSPACVITINSAGGLVPPFVVVAEVTSPSRITVTWPAVTGAELYYVYQSGSGPGGPFEGVAAVSGTSYETPDLTPSASYCYQIQAANSVGASALSQPPACAKTGAAGLVARWKLDEKTGSIAHDSSGNTFTGTLQGATSIVTTPVAPLLDESAHNSSLLSAPGGSADFVTVPDHGAFTFGTGDFTVSLWVNGAATGTVHLIGKRAAGCGATNWELGTDGGSFFFSGATSSSFGTLAPNTWTHVAVTNAGGSATFYVNGQPVGTGTFTAGDALGDALQLGNAGGCGNGSAALIDEVRIYGTALAAADVAALGVRPPAPQNLRGTVVSSTRVDLAWDPVEGADMYIIYRGSAAGNETFLTTALPASATYIEGHLSPSQTTSWQVRAVINGLVSDLSNEVVITSAAPPPPPTIVRAEFLLRDRLNLAWHAPPPAVVSYIYMSTEGGPFVAIGGTPYSVFDVANLAPNTTYTFRVAVIDSGGTFSEMSAPVSRTTKP